MTSLIGTPILTYSIKSGETVRISYGINALVDIMNGTDGALKVSNEDTFTGTSFFVIPSGGAYNEYRPNSINMTQSKAELYLQAETDGDISVVVTSRR